MNLLCASRKWGIDFAIANHEIPSRVPDLPILLKQVCQCGNDAMLQAAVMVLMISVKNACQNGWFSDKDSKDLNNLAHEIASNFCSSLDCNADPSSYNAVIADIMSRFYPRLKMGQILTFLEVKPGYGAYVKDFQISKHMKLSPGEKIRLFVAQTDSTETPSCLINPPKVNFLLNGKGVERRNSVYMETGPQMPTIVTHILKYGSNLVQAVGQFNGNYIILVASMKDLSAIENPTLQDYVQPASDIVEPDSELIVGASRISLNCPISFTRIRTPVKGQSCKHFECFDLNNYMDINSKRPSWRCPHCNNYCCFPDIRIDQNMVKVLKEVGENVNDVIISTDGSWKAIMESDDHPEAQPKKLPRRDQDEPNSAIFSNASVDIMDLTENDVDVTNGVFEPEDVKVSRNSSASQTSIQNMANTPNLNRTNEVQQSILPPIVESSSWSGIYWSTFQPGTSSAITEPLREHSVNRIPIAVQALPAAQSLTNISPRLGNSSTNAFPLAASQPSSLSQDSLSAHLSSIERQLQSGSDPNVLPVPMMSTQQQHLTSRVSGSQAITQTPGTYQMNLGRPSGVLNPNLIRLPHPVNQSAGRSQQPAQASGTFFHSRNNQGGLPGVPTRAVGSFNQQHHRPLADQPANSVSRAFQNSRPPPLSVNAAGNTPQSVPRPEVGVNQSPNQDWRPTGRMRGSLSGQAYSAALNQFITRPMQQAQAIRPPPTLNSSVARTPTNVMTSGPNSAALLDILMANRAAMQAASSNPTTGVAAMTSTAGSLPSPPTTGTR
ncbi:OLC1v1029873C2 [Oldenlandia corymbosa var. corymbosa]|uniref:OLC1v1029873C2 n=1 Tax=Oldenlandia corymbosa var. corymbosa TaxID=529605 RepID=A0AAV1CHU5_OLDCO|nr:OLC1v1029873C2 [Oldenlandia corymbosa var. corymbosa]